MLNEYIRAMSYAQRIAIYNGFSAVMYPAVLLALLLVCRRSRVNRKQTVLTVVSFFTALFGATSFAPVLGDLTNGWIPGRNMGIAFALFVPLAVLMLKLCRLPVFRGLDCVIPTYITGRGVGILGCLFSGCCHGHYAGWGIYSHHAGATVVPAPLIDTVLSFTICAVLWRKKNRRAGEIAALATAAFGALRYAVDILRDNEKAFGLFGVEGAFGGAYLLAGLFFLYFLLRKKEPALQDAQ